MNRNKYNMKKNKIVKQEPAIADKTMLVAGVGAAIQCPMCGGCGKIKSPHFQQKAMKEKELTAKLMRRQGYSIREIMKAMKYKSPRCVAKLLNK